MATVTLSPVTTSERIVSKGIVAGLGGGVVFGIQMAIMDFFPMIAQMVGSNNVGIGIILHLLISATFGIGYALIGRKFSSRPLVSGMLYGALVWIVGGLVLMPLFLKMPEMVFQIGSMQWWSLLGHELYGITTALIFAGLKNNVQR